MNKRIYTIGHYVHSVEVFIGLLNAHRITCVVDVRSNTESIYHMAYNKENIRTSLNAEGISYIHMGKEFGLKRSDPRLYDANGKLNFDKVKKSWGFKSGIHRVNKLVKKKEVIALMCTEKMPQNCHRCIVVGKEFYDRGYDVKHILADSTLMSHAEIEAIILDMYIHGAGDKIEYNAEEKQKYINNAYRIREARIASDARGRK